MSFFNRLSQRDQILVAFGVILVIAVAIFFLFLMPQFGRLGELAGQEEEQTRSLQEAKLNLQRLRSIQSDAAQIESKLIKLTRRLPQDAEVPSLLVEMQNVADSSGLDFTSAKLDAVVEKTGFAEIPMTIKAEGTFYSLVDYLYRIESMARKVVVTNVAITSTEKDYPNLQIEIKAKTYKLSKGGTPTLPAPGAPAGTAAPAPAGGQAPPAGGTPAAGQ